LGEPVGDIDEFSPATIPGAGGHGYDSVSLAAIRGLHTPFVGVAAAGAIERGVDAARFRERRC
jgi:hypothetical protein